MKIEKLNENKIKIIFNSEDLEKNNIDFHSFMSNSLETQNLFLSLLNEAEKEVGFITDNYNIAIEALSLNNGSFILIVTRLEQKTLNLKSGRVHTKRKLNKVINSVLIYKFNDFEDFCDFCTLLSNYSPEIILSLKNKNTLYKYKNNYFFVINNLYLSKYSLTLLCSNITEFAICINNPIMFLNKLNEYGTLIVKDNAINTCISNFQL